MDFYEILMTYTFLQLIFIDAYRREEEGDGWGVTSCTPSKGFKKFCHKNAIKHKNRGHPLGFLTTQSSP
jgi:hypothetical protein